MTPELGERYDALLAQAGLTGVSRETTDRLVAFEAEFRRWAARINLVAPSTLNVFAERHVVDSAQILAQAGPIHRVLDLGSGGGFPGLVLAFLLAGTLGAHVDLVESNGKKCGFLRHVIRQFGLPAAVHCARIEDVIGGFATPDIVTARALAPLDQLLVLAAPQLERGARAFFHKGRDYREEITRARGQWEFDLVVHPSPVDDESVVLEISAPGRIAAPA